MSHLKVRPTKKETVSRSNSLQTSLFEAPGGALGPAGHGLGSPGSGLAGVTLRAGIGNFVFVGQGWSDEAESVGPDESFGDAFGFDFGHVAGDALASGAVGFVMGMLLKGSGAGTVGRKRAVAIQAELVGGLS